MLAGPLLLALSLLLAGPAGGVPDPTASFLNTAGVASRCNRTESCLPHSARSQYSFDWFCCEDNNGWVAPHFVLPLWTFVYSRSFWVTTAQILLSETAEVTFLTLAVATGLTDFDDNRPLETWSGSLFGDGLHGMLAILTGYLFVRAVNSRRMLWPAAVGTAPASLKTKYFFLWALYAAIFAANLWRTAGALNPGMIVVTVVHFPLLFWFYPWVTTLTSADHIYVWRVRSRQQAVATARRLFRWFAVIELAINLQTVGLQYLANDWYQVWISVVVVTLVAGLVAAFRAP